MLPAKPRPSWCSTTIFPRLSRLYVSPQDLRQSSKGDDVCLRHPSSDRRTIVAPRLVWIAVGSHATAHRVSGVGDRSGLFDGFRVRTGTSADHEQAATQSQIAIV